MSELQSRRTKSKTGCIGCRLRRKKCGEERPKCRACTRNGLICVFPERGNPQHAELTRRTNSTCRLPAVGTRAVSVEKRGAHYAASPSSCRTQHLDHSSPMDLETLDLSAAEHSMPMQSLPSPLSLDPYGTEGSFALRRSTSRRLFHHYIHRTNKAIGVCRKDVNPFLTELLPIAMANDLIMNAVLACSGIQYADLSGHSIDETTWVHYGQAVQGQKYGLTQLEQGNKEVLVPLLITSVLLCIVESFRENCGANALYHLQGARHLLQKALHLPTAEFGESIRAFLVERVAYAVTLAHISMGPESDQWVVEETAGLFSLMRQSSTEAAGESHVCVHELFSYIPRVSILARRVSRSLSPVDVSYNDMSYYDAAAEYQQLSEAISSWQPVSADETHNIIGLLYQQALLVYLASIFDTGGCGTTPFTYSSSTQAAFDTFISFLLWVPPDASISTTLCWPLAVFGSCAKSDYHRSFILDRLDTLSKVYASRSISETKSLLERLYKKSGQEATSPLSFTGLMERGRSTVLFL